MSRSHDELVRVSELALASVLTQASRYRAFPLQVDVVDMGGRILRRLSIESVQDGRDRHTVLVQGIAMKRSHSLRLFPPSEAKLDLKVWSIRLSGFREYEKQAVPIETQQKRFKEVRSSAQV